MFHEQVLPRLQRRVSATRSSRELRVTALANRTWTVWPAGLHPLSEVQTTVLASPGEVQIHLRMWTEDAAHAEATFVNVEPRLGPSLNRPHFSRDGSPLEVVVAHDLLNKTPTIAAAESCTGGLFAERLTDHRRQLRLFSRRRGLLQQRNEDCVADVPRK